jgi:hypothetical protein
MAELVVRLMLRLPRDLHDAIYAMAHAEQRSLNGQIIYLLRRAIEGHTI